MESLQRTHNRGSISTGAYQIENSVKLESDNTEFFIKNTMGTTGNRKTWTVSMWCKKTEEAASAGLQTLYAANVSGNEGVLIRFGTENAAAEDALQVDIGAGSTNYRNYTWGAFRDSSAWYHIVVACDTTQSDSTNRLKIYVNGVYISYTAYYGRADPALNFDTSNNLQGAFQSVGAYETQSTVYGKFNGYIADAYNIDGTALEPTAFGEFSPEGIWRPIAYTGSYGTNGFFLEFKNASSMGADSSGEGNSPSVQNVNQVDQSSDTPTNNFCTLNPLVKFKYGTNAGGMTNGATVYANTTGGGVGGAFGTFAVTAGKWYWEMKLTEQVSHYIGISAYPDDGDRIDNHSDPHQINSSFVFNISAARIEYVNNGTVSQGSLDAFNDLHSVGMIIGIALNMDDNQINIYGNGSLQTGVQNSSIYDASNKMVVPFHASINDEVQYNFGGYSAWLPSSVESDENGYGTFEYAPPSGYYALCTKNLAEFGG